MTSPRRSIALAAALGLAASPALAARSATTSRGKYYQLTGSLEGYDDVIKKYRKCTSCHAKYPGSQRLTRKGQRFQEQGKAMDHVLLEPGAP